MVNVKKRKEKEKKSRGKAHEKKLRGTKLGFLPFSQGCFIRFP